MKNYKSYLCLIGLCLIVILCLGADIIYRPEEPGVVVTSPLYLGKGKNVGISGVGHHIATVAGDGHLHLHAHSEFDGELTTADCTIVDAYDYEAKVLFQGDNSGTWTGTELTFTIYSPAHLLTKNGYLQTDTVAAKQVVNYCIYEGTDDTGKMIFDQAYEPSVFPASTEVQFVANNFIEFDEGVTYYHKITSGSNMSFKMDVTNTSPWFASDISYLREDSILQTAPYEDGGTYSLNQWMVVDRKIYACNTAGVQTGTWASNSALWDILGTGSTVSTFWEEAGGVLHNKAGSTGFYFNDGTRDRLRINSDTKITSADGLKDLKVADSGTDITGDLDITGSFTAESGSNILLAEPWLAGTDYDVGDWVIENRRVFQCLTSGVQTTDFASNSRRWNCIADHFDYYNSTTGWLHGGDISINAGDNTLIDITAGSMLRADYSDPEFPVNHVVHWPAYVGIDPGLTSGTKWIAIVGSEDNAHVIAFDQEFNAVARREAAVIGRVWNSAGTYPIVGSVSNYKHPAWGLQTAFQDFIIEFGAWNIDGNVYAPAVAGNLTLTKNSGMSYRYAADTIEGIENIHADTGVTSITFYLYVVQGSGAIPQTTIDPEYWDNAGTRTAVPTDKWTVQEVWFYPVSEITTMLYGQSLYDTRTEAEKAILSVVPVRNQEDLNGAILRAYLVVQQGATDLTDTDTAIIHGVIGAGQMGTGSSASAVSHWNNTGGVLSPSEVNDSVTVNGTITAPTFLGDLNGTINTLTTGVTQSPLNNSTKIATTEYVDSSVSIENIWDRNGTTVELVNIGDGVGIGVTDMTTSYGNAHFKVKSPQTSFNVIAAESSVGKDLFWLRESTDSDGSIHMFDKTEAQTVLIVTDENDSYFNGGGNYGFGTDSPSYKLTVKTGVANDGIRLLNASDGLRLRLAINNLDDGYLGMTDRNDAETILFATEPGTDSYINTGGNFGIGIVIPTEKLHVIGNVEIASGFMKMGSGYPVIWGDASTSINGSSVTDAEYIKLQTAGAVRLTVDGDGNVGIGTAPGAKLDVQDDTLTTGSLVNFQSSSADITARSLVEIHNTNAAAVGVTALHILQDSTGLALDVAGDSRFANDMEITSGNVSILSGKLGVGIDTDEAGGVKLMVRTGVTNDGIYLVNAGKNVRSCLTIDSTDNGLLDMMDAAHADIIHLNTKAGADSWINNGGKFGFGTDSPNAKVTIDTTGTYPALVTESATVDGAANTFTADSLALGSIAYFHSDSASTTSRHLVRIENHNVAAVNARCLYIEDDAAGVALEIYKGSLKIGGGKGLDIYNGGDIHLWSGSDIILESGDIEMTGDIRITGTIDVTTENINMQGGDILVNGGKLSFSGGQPTFVVPRMTTDGRIAKTPGINGEIIYNTSLNRFEFFENNAWVTK